MKATQAQGIVNRQFIVRSEADLKKAEQYQSRMYNKYNSVVVQQLGPDRINIQCADKI